jgi:hypothetical protein
MSDTTTAALHVYEIEEAGCVTHWVVARDADEARRLVLDTGAVEEESDLEVAEEIPDDQPWTVTYVDGFDYPERWQDEIPPGARVEHPDGRVPAVTATAGEWARWTGRPAYSGCSEY